MTGITRRTALQTMIASSTAVAFPRLFAAEPSTRNDLSKLAKYVHPKISWSYTELNDFLDVLPDTGLVSIQKSLELITHDAEVTKIDDRKEAVKTIQTKLLWFSSNIVTYPFLDEDKIRYHNLTKWVGSELGVDQWILDTQPTFVIERAIHEKLLVDVWDKMNEEQRLELLSKVDTSGHLPDHAAVAALSGAGALAALSMTVHLAGFSFYTTMSTAICAIANLFGLTLPFAAYTTASTVVAFLTGPVGWALLAIATAAGVTLAGRANPRKTAAAICQIHALKVAAMQAANETDESIFNVMGDPIKRQLVGSWRTRSKDESIDLTLASDGSFKATCYRTPTGQDQEANVLWKGRGTWTVRDKALSVNRQETWYYLGWVADERVLYDKRKVLDITPTSVKLEDDAILLRL
jgi:uncharacterized protein YaaW (UPF0174 family)